MPQEEKLEPEPEILQKKEKEEKSDKDKSHTAMYSIFP
jgi:hypothetical protein